MTRGPVGLVATKVMNALCVASRSRRRSGCASQPAPGEIFGSRGERGKTALVVGALGIGSERASPARRGSTSGPDSAQASRRGGDRGEYFQVTADRRLLGGRMGRQFRRCANVGFDVSRLQVFGARTTSDQELLRVRPSLLWAA